MYHNIKDGAIFISDSHYNTNRKELLGFLKNLPPNTTQIFLMGDIFDFLCEEIDFFKKQNKILIDLINQLSKNIDIIYIEGNHDFNLQNIFPDVEIIPREKQAIIMNANGKKVLLCHGDLDMGFWYEFYTFFIRKAWFLKILNFIDRNNWFTKWVNEKLQHKNLYYEFEDFDNFSKKRVLFFQNYQLEKKHDIIIEGHYHQGKENLINSIHYINLPTFANNQYIEYTDNKFQFKAIKS